MKIFQIFLYKKNDDISEEKDNNTKYMKYEK